VDAEDSPAEVENEAEDVVMAEGSDEEDPPGSDEEEPPSSDDYKRRMCCRKECHMPKRPMLYPGEELAALKGGFHELRALRCSALLPGGSPGDRKVQCQNAVHRHPRCSDRNLRESDNLIPDNKWVCNGAITAGRGHDFRDDSEVAERERSFVAKRAAHLGKCGSTRPVKPVNSNRSLIGIAPQDGNQKSTESRARVRGQGEKDGNNAAHDDKDEDGESRATLNPSTKRVRQALADDRAAKRSRAVVT